MADVGIVMPVSSDTPSDQLAAAIQSLLKQTYQRFHLIVVLPAEAEQLKQQAQSAIGADRRIDIIDSPAHTGLAYALNQGFDVLLASSSIKYVTWVLGTGVYHPRYAELLRRALESGPPELGLVYSSFFPLDENGNRTTSEAGQAALRQFQARPQESMLDNSLVGASFMYRASFARQTGGYRHDSIDNDDYWLRMSELCRIRHIPIELADVRECLMYSVSEGIKPLDELRKWRYRHHLARVQARHRRGIEPEVTILFPVAKVNDQEKAVIESLYDQAFTNYSCVILDLSHDQQPIHVLSQVSHPTSSFHWFPGVSATRAILYGLPYAMSRYTLVLGGERFGHWSDLKSLVEYSKKSAGPDEVSWYHTPGMRHIAERKKSDLSHPKQDLFLELYVTNSLTELITAIIAGGG